MAEDCEWQWYLLGQTNHSVTTWNTCWYRIIQEYSQYRVWVLLKKEVKMCLMVPFVFETHEHRGKDWGEGFYVLSEWQCYCFFKMEFLCFTFVSGHNSEQRFRLCLCAIFLPWTVKINMWNKHLLSYKCMYFLSLWSKAFHQNKKIVL